LKLRAVKNMEDALSLRWIGVQEGCVGDSLSGKPVLAGTKVKNGLQQDASIRGLRPNRVYIFPRCPKGVAKRLLGGWCLSRGGHLVGARCAGGSVGDAGPC
jgi:hypothetical protein